MTKWDKFQEEIWNSMESENLSTSERVHAFLEIAGVVAIMLFIAWVLAR